MPDTSSLPAQSRKLGGIPQGEATSPGIYRKPPSFKMRIIPRPPEQRAVRKNPSAAPLYIGLVAVAAVLGGGAAYLFFKIGPQMTGLWSRPAATPAPVAVADRPMPVFAPPLAEATPGHTWVFEESEWRTPDARHEVQDGLVHLRNRMDKPQVAADAAIRATILIREGGAAAGVFLRGTPQGERYRLTIDSDLRFLRLVYEGPGDTVRGRQEIGRYRFFKALQRGDRLVIELRAEGSHLYGSINGEQVIEAEDARLTAAGSWGIESENAWYELVESALPSSKPVAVVTPPAAPTPPPPVAELAPVPPAPAPSSAPANEPAPAPKPMAEAAPQPVVPAVSEIAKWLAGMEPQWQAGFEKEVMAPYQKSVDDLKKQFIGTLETQLAAATQAKKFDDAAFFRGERKRLEAGEDVPMTDESIVPPSLRTLRNGFRTSLVELDRQRFARAKAFLAKTDATLGQTETALMQRKRTAEAAEVKAKREQYAALWLKPPMTIAAPPSAGGTAATATPARPAPGAAPTPSPAKLPVRQVVEKLLGIGAEVWITQKGSTNTSQVKAVAEVSGDRFTIARVNFRRENDDDKPLTAADLALLDAIPEATEVELRSAAVNDAIMEKLRPLRKLEKLTLEGAKIGPAGVAVLAALPDLKQLRITNVGVSDDAFKVIGQCHRIERLYLTTLPIGDAALALIGKLPELQELDLNNIDKVSAAGIQHLAECRTLRHLNFTGSDGPSSVIEAIGKCTSLETLNLSGVSLKDDQLAALSPLAKLHSLNLNNTGIVGTGFSTWPGRAAMTTLNLTNKAGVNDAALKAICLAFPKLENLDISGVPSGATAAGFGSISRLRSLRSLEVRGGLVNDELLAEIDRCPELQYLHLPNAQLTELGVASLAKLPRLSMLELGVPPLTDAALKAFGKCKALKTIEISESAPADTEAKLRGAINGVTIRR